MATDYEESEDKENSLSELPAENHVPQRNKPAETSVVVEVNYANSTKMSQNEGSEIGKFLKYITRKEWKAVLNIIFKIKEVQTVLPLAVQSAINREFDLYCKSPNSLKKTSPEDLKNHEELVPKCQNLVILKLQTPLLCQLQLWHGAEKINCM